VKTETSPSPDVRQTIEERLNQIDEQLEAFGDLQAERDTLRRFLVELGEPAPAERNSSVTRRRRSTTTSATRRPSASKARARNTARRSGSQTAILDHLAKHPGAAAPEIADATGLQRNVVYSILSRLAARDQVERIDTEDGLKQYRLVQSD